MKVKLCPFHKLDNITFAPCSTNHEPFSVSKYLERIEAEHIALLEQEERRKRLDDTCVLILWIGLDGLRLNENGELDWIRRNEEKKDESAPVPTIERTYKEVYDWDDKLNCCCIRAKDSTMETFSQIQQLQMQNILLQCQAFMQSQTQNMINNMGPNYSPARVYGYGQFNPYCYNPMQQFRWF